MDQLELNQNLSVSMERGRGVLEQLDLKGFFHVEHFNAAGELLGTYDLENGITNEGKNALLNIMFHGSTQITTWYIGIIDNGGTPTEAAADTLVTHTWTEFTNYTGNRLAWVEDAAASQSITNTTPTSFPILGTAVLKGIFIASVATGTSGTLWSTADFASTVAVANGDTLKITYTVNA